MIDQRRLDELYKLAYQIERVTEVIDQLHSPPEALLTSSDLAKLFNLNRDHVKKHLRFLKEMGLVRAIGLSPKRYRFDFFHYRQLLNDLFDQDELSQALLRRLQESQRHV